MEILTSLLVFSAVISILVFVHEMGHFLAGKLFDFYMPAFSIGMGPVILRKQLGETEYRLSLLPIGGYVKFSGMDFSDEPSENPRDFYNKPRWQQWLAVFAGPTASILFAVAVHATLLASQPSRAAFLQSLAPEVGFVTEDSPAATAGIEIGDRILAINNEPISEWTTILQHIHMAGARPLKITLLRNADTLIVEAIAQKQGDTYRMGLSPATAVRITDVLSDGAAAKNGMRAGDILVAVDEAPTRSILHAQQLLKEQKSHTLLVRHNDGTYGNIVLDPATTWGFSLETPMPSLAVVPAVQKSIEFNWGLVALHGDFIRSVAKKETKLSENVAGPVRIAQLSGQVAQAGVIEVISFMGILSLILGIMNLLPIPVLDGGHLMIIGSEMIMGRSISAQARKVLTLIGLALLLALMTFVIGNDIVNLFR